MAQLVVAAIGAAIGSAIAPGVVAFGLTGASIGWTVGSILGAQLGPRQKFKGPVLEDLRVTGVEYGQAIPWFAGHPRMAAQIWWASDKIPIATTTEVGKGGGGAEYTSYTYEINLLLGLADRRIGGVSRVWQNGKLVFSKLSDSSVESALSSKAQGAWRRMTVYTGHEEQLPDPVYETAVGVGYAPAYRDRGTVFIEGLQLGSSGQLSVLTFEVYEEGIEEGRTPRTVGYIPDGYSDGAPAFSLPSFTLMNVLHPTTRETVVYRFTLGLEEPEIVNQFVHTMVDCSNPTRLVTDVTGMFLSKGTGTAAAWVDEDGNHTSFTMPYAPGLGSWEAIMARRDGQIVFGSGWQSVANTKRIYRFTSAGGTVVATSAVMATAIRAITIANGFVYALNAPGSLADATEVWIFDLATLTLQSTISPPPGADENAHLMTDELDDVYCYAGIILYRLDGTSWTAVRTVIGGMLAGQTLNRLGIIGGDLWGVVRMGGGFDTEIRVMLDSVDLVETTVQATVDAICERAGMPAGSWDSSALASITTPVRAFASAQVTPARALLEQLAAAYFFDGYCADKLYFIPRGAASAATIGVDELGVGNGEAESVALVTTQSDPAALPARHSLSYLNADADYNTDTQITPLIIGAQGSVASVAFPLVLTAQEANIVVSVMQADAITGRVSGTARVPLTRTLVTPTDVLTLVDGDGTTYRARVVRRHQEGPVVTLDWVLDDTTALQAAGRTSTAYEASLVVALPSLTSILLMDIPLLRDEDNLPGLYAVAKPLGTVWPGYKLMSSVAGGDYEEVGTGLSRGVFGEVTVALTNYTLATSVFDEAGSVTVDVGLGNTLSSYSRDAILAGTADGYLIGDEIIYARTATLVSDGVYKLTSLLRGQRGTDRAMTGHAIGERAVLLRPAGMLRVSYDAARIGTSANYKGVTLGKPLSSATARTIIDSGERLRPWSPVDLRQTPIADGVLRISWSRRSRISQSWPAEADLPLGELAEAYDVELYNLSDSLVSTQRVTSPQVTFSSAFRTQTLSEGVGWMTVIGSDYYGLKFEGNSLRTVLKLDSAGVLQAESFSLGDYAYKMQKVGTDLFAVAVTLTSAGNPRTVMSTDIWRIDSANMSSIGAQYTMPTDGDAYSFHHDGTYVWVPGYITGNLYQLNGTTLALIGSVAMASTAYGIDGDGTWLYMSSGSTAEAFAYEPGGSPAEKWRTAISSGPRQVLVRSGKVYVACSAAIEVLDAATGAIIATIPGGPAMGSDGMMQLVNFDSYVVGRTGGGEVLFIDATTGLLAFTATLPEAGIGGLCGEGNGLLWAAGSPTLSYTDYQSWGYELTPTLVGFDVKVYQISATVGRGHPATYTIT